jgi:hypothetical protein
MKRFVDHQAIRHADDPVALGVGSREVDGALQPDGQALARKSWSAVSARTRGFQINPLRIAAGIASADAPRSTFQPREMSSALATSASDNIATSNRVQAIETCFFILINLLLQQQSSVLMHPCSSFCAWIQMDSHCFAHFTTARAALLRWVGRASVSTGIER